MKLIGLILALWCAAPAFGQLTENVVTHTASACNSAATSCTLSVTVAAGDDRYMFVFAGENASTLQNNGATYAGQALTRQGGIAQGGATMGIELYTLADPPVGTADLIVNWDTSIASALAVYVVNGSAGFSSALFADFDAVSQDPVGFSETTVSGDWLVAAAAVRSATCDGDGAADTEVDDSQIGGTGRLLCVSSEQATGTPTVISLDLSTSALVAIASVVIIPDTGGADTGAAYTQTLRRRRNSQ